ncbi:hypothetical protein A2U01_0079995, partial [Trifolium medium]|nr:hypothetical protein [Trifolium medium]
MEVASGVHVGEVRVVQLFQDVFPSEISGFPGLHPGTRPISESPYRIAPA